MPAEEKPLTAILVANYGEAVAINLYGPAYGLPEAISGVNNYYLRGYGDPPPQVVIIVGAEFSPSSYFKNCRFAGQTKNPYGVANEEVREHSYINLCRGLRIPWSEFWKLLKDFG